MGYLKVMSINPEDFAGARHSDNVSKHAAGVNLATKSSSSAGRTLGHSTSHSKSVAAQKNGAKGGRPVGS